MKSIKKYISHETLFLIAWAVLVLIIGVSVACLFRGCSNSLSERFSMESLPTYDMNGNVYTIRKTYDHKPTKKDSSDFIEEYEYEIKRIMDSIESIK
jgi:hypothetical protein